MLYANERESNGLFAVLLRFLDGNCEGCYHQDDFVADLPFLVCEDFGLEPAVELNLCALDDVSEVGGAGLPYFRRDVCGVGD